MSQEHRHHAPTVIAIPARDKAKGPARRPGPLFVEGHIRPSTENVDYLLPVFLPALILAGRLARLALPGAGAHSNSGARLHLAGLHPVRFHLVLRLHLGVGGGARSDIAFARRARSRLRLCRRDCRRPEQ